MLQDLSSLVLNIPCVIWWFNIQHFSSIKRPENCEITWPLLNLPLFLSHYVATVKVILLKQKDLMFKCQLELKEISGTDHCHFWIFMSNDTKLKFNSVSTDFNIRWLQKDSSLEKLFLIRWLEALLSVQKEGNMFSMRNK